jgi:cyanophycinase-like exopeptidase
MITSTTTEISTMKRTLVLLLALTFSLPALAGPATKLPYTYVRVGSANNVNTPVSGGTVLMGGGTDVDAAFQWMCGRNGGGDFLVIRATGTDAYNPYIKDLCPSGNSVATLIIPTLTAANHAAVKAYIDQAEAIWIAGGDQSNYVNFWKNTPVEDAINAAIGRGVPVGGTSAGMNVLTEFVYSALASQGVTSSQALADPFNKYMSFTKDFLSSPYLLAKISDPHFVTRDRMGRELAFLCRIYTNGWTTTMTNPRSIAVDEETALLIDTNGTATVVGNSTAYFFQAPGGPEVCKAKTPLTYENVAVYRIDATTGSFNLANWVGSNGTEYTVSATKGVLSSTQAGGFIY